MDCLNCKIKNLYYSTIEDKITNYYNMGYSDNSNLPSEMRENESDTFIIIATKKYGEFHIKITKQPDEMYWLSVYPVKLKNNE